MSHLVSSPWKTRVVLYLVSQNLSLFGSSVVGFAIVWHITLQTSSGVWMMWATIACTVPQVALLLWGGVWADRYNRRHLIMASDGFVALITLALAVASMSGAANLWLLFGALALRSLGSGVQGPASAALYTQIVPVEHLYRIQGINQTINAFLMLLSPAVGGVLLGATNLAWAMMADVITATVAIVVMGFIKTPDKEHPAGRQSALQEIRHGLAYTFRHPQLRLLVIGYAVFFFLATPAAVLSPLMIARSFGEEVWRLTVNELVWSSASVIGGICISYRREFKNKARALTVCMVCFGAAFGLMGFAGNFLVYLCLLGAAGFIMPVFATTGTVFIQQITDSSMLGRVFSIVQIISTGAFPAGILLFGPSADYVSVESLLILTGFLMSAVGLYYLAIYEHRKYFSY